MAETKKKTASETKSQTRRKKVQTEEPKVETTVSADAINEKDAEIEALKAEIRRQNEAISQLQKPQVIVTQADAERVHFLWMDNVSDDNIMDFGQGGMYGRIVGKTGNFFVPKNELSRILDSANRYFIEHRNLIIISGLTDEEREMMGVNYNEGELLDVKTFTKIAELPKDKLIDVYTDLCEEHKAMLAERLHEAYESKRHVDRDTVLALNKIYPNPALKDIIEQMNEADTKA